MGSYVQKGPQEKAVRAKVRPEVLMRVLSPVSPHPASSFPPLVHTQAFTVLSARASRPFSMLWTPQGITGGSVVKNHPPHPSSQCRRRGFHPWGGDIPWRRKWQPIPVFLPGKSHGQRSLAGYSPWCCKSVRCNWACTQAFIVLSLCKASWAFSMLWTTLSSQSVFLEMCQLRTNYLTVLWGLFTPRGLNQTSFKNS